MAILYGRQTKTSRALSAKEASEKKCPHCLYPMELVEQQEDRIVCKCENCGATNIFTFSPDEIERAKGKKPKTKKFSTFTLRDKSQKSKKKKKPEIKEGPPKPVDPDQKPENVHEDEAVQRIATIREGMQKQQVLTFEYVSSKGMRTSRAVEPYKIERNKKGEIVLWAWCQEGEGIRQFKLHGVSGVEISGYPYKPRFDVEDKLK